MRDYSIIHSFRTSRRVTFLMCKKKISQDWKKKRTTSAVTLVTTFEIRTIAWKKLFCFFMSKYFLFASIFSSLYYTYFRFCKQFKKENYGTCLARFFCWKIRRNCCRVVLCAKFWCVCFFFSYFFRYHFFPLAQPALIWSDQFRQIWTLDPSRQTPKKATTTRVACHFQKIRINIVDVFFISRFLVAMKINYINLMKICTLQCLV